MVSTGLTPGESANRQLGYRNLKVWQPAASFLHRRLKAEMITCSVSEPLLAAEILLGRLHRNAT